MANNFFIAITMCKHNELAEINKLYHFVLMKFVHLPASLFFPKWVCLREGDFWNLTTITIAIKLVWRHLEYVSILSYFWYCSPGFCLLGDILLFTINVDTENQKHSLVVNTNIVKSSKQSCNVYNRSVCVRANKFDRLCNILMKWCPVSSKNSF